MKVIFFSLLLTLLISACGSNESIQDESPAPVDPSAIIISVSPNSGPTYGGTMIKLTGFIFQPGAKVYFGSAALKLMISTDSFYVGPTEIYVSSPPFFSGKFDVIVKNPGVDTSYTLGSFTYYNPPSAPAPLPNASASAADTLGLVYQEANLFNLFPAGQESNLDIKFQMSTSRYCKWASQFHPLAGNFSGSQDPSGRNDTVGFFDQKDHKFYLKYSNTPGAEDLVLDFGSKTSMGIAGDWNGDGVSTVGVFESSTGVVQLKNSNVPGPADVTFVLGTGNPYEVSLAGDWNGDGVTTLGIFNGFTREIRLRNSNSAGPAEIVFTVADINAIPVVGDWNNDGKDTISFYDRRSFQLYIKNTLDASLPERSILISPSNSPAIPIAGRWKPGTSATYSGYNWPTGTPSSQGIDPVKLQAGIASARSLPALRSLLVVRNGVLVSENYFNGAGPTIAYELRSVSKSILSALYGIAYRDSLLNMLAPLTQYLPPDKFPANGDPRLSYLTLLHLLTMSADIKWVEYLAHDYWKSDDWTKWYLAQPFDLPALTNPPRADQLPGSKFVYSTGSTHIAAQILADKVGDISAFADRELFQKIGIRLAQWDHDPQGYKVGGAEMYLTPRDMARFGQLYMDRGVVNGQQLIPREWVDYTTSIQISVGDGRDYGGWWWIYHLKTPSGAQYQVYTALGYGGQYIINIPALNTMIVATSMPDVPSDQDGFQDALFFSIVQNNILPAVTP